MPSSMSLHTTERKHMDTTVKFIQSYHQCINNRTGSWITVNMTAQQQLTSSSHLENLV